MAKVPNNDSDSPPDYSNCVQELHYLQRDIENEDHAVTSRKLPALKRFLFRTSPWLALTALLLIVVMTFFMCYLWKDLQQVELRQDKLATQIELDHAARENFLSELTEMIAEQEKTHVYSLEELEKKIKSALELMSEQEKTHQSTLKSLEKKIEEARKLMAEQQRTHPYTPEELEMKIGDVLAINGEDQPKPKDDSFKFWWSSSGATTGLPWRLAPLVSSLVILLLWQQ